MELGIPMIALFPHIEEALKTPDGREAANPDGLIPRAVKALKAAYPQLGVMTDVALDPYTTHGQDGLIDEEGYPFRAMMLSGRIPRITRFIRVRL